MWAAPPGDSSFERDAAMGRAHPVRRYSPEPRRHPTAPSAIVRGTQFAGPVETPRRQLDFNIAATDTDAAVRHAPGTTTERSVSMGSVSSVTATTGPASRRASPPPPLVFDVGAHTSGTHHSAIVDPDGRVEMRFGRHRQELQQVEQQSRAQLGLDYANGVQAAVGALQRAVAAAELNQRAAAAREAAGQRAAETAAKLRKQQNHSARESVLFASDRLQDAITPSVQRNGNVGGGPRVTLLAEERRSKVRAGNAPPPPPPVLDLSPSQEGTTSTAGGGSRTVTEQQLIDQRALHEARLERAHAYTLLNVSRHISASLAYEVGVRDAAVHRLLGAERRRERQTARPAPPPPSSTAVENVEDDDVAPTTHRHDRSANTTTASCAMADRIEHLDHALSVSRATAKRLQAELTAQSNKVVVPLQNALEAAQVAAGQERARAEDLQRRLNGTRRQFTASLEEHSVELQARYQPPGGGSASTSFASSPLVAIGRIDDSSPVGRRVATTTKGGVPPSYPSTPPSAASFGVPPVVCWNGSTQTEDVRGQSRAVVDQSVATDALGWSPPTTAALEQLQMAVEQAEAASRRDRSLAEDLQSRLNAARQRMTEMMREHNEELLAMERLVEATRAEVEVVRVAPEGPSEGSGRRSSSSLMLVAPVSQTTAVAVQTTAVAVADASSGAHDVEASSLLTTVMSSAATTTDTEEGGPSRVTWTSDVEDRSIKDRPTRRRRPSPSPSSSSSTTIQASSFETAVAVGVQTVPQDEGSRNPTVKERATSPVATRWPSPERPRGDRDDGRLLRLEQQLLDADTTVRTLRAEALRREELYRAELAEAQHEAETALSERRDLEAQLCAALQIPPSGPGSRSASASHAPPDGGVPTSRTPSRKGTIQRRAGEEGVARGASSTNGESVASRLLDYSAKLQRNQSRQRTALREMMTIGSTLKLDATNAASREREDRRTGRDAESGQTGVWGRLVRSFQVDFDAWAVRHCTLLS